MLKHKKVLIVLDDVVKPVFLETLVGKTEWFESGSRIIVITQDRQILKGHKIDLLYEVRIPDQDLALKMLCQSAFGQNYPPDNLKELAVKVADVAGNLPLGLSVLGKSLKERTKEEWMEFLVDLQNGLDGDIMERLRVSYDRLEEKYKNLFLYIACLFNGKSVKFINDFFGDVNAGLKRLAEKSLIRITPNRKNYGFMSIRPDEKYVEMHDLLMNLGRKIVREESMDNPGKRRFLTDAKEIEDVLIDQSGTETILGILFKPLAPESYISFDEKSFIVMRNLQFLKIDDFFRQMNDSKLRLPNGLVYLPRKLKYLDWKFCPLKCLPSNFKAEYLVELRMENSKLEKLWEGTQQLGSLKTIIMRYSKYLKEIPDLSRAINLEMVDFSSCYNLESFPSPLNSESLVYLDLEGCFKLKNFPCIRMVSLPHGTEITVYNCLWDKNLPGLDYLDCLRRCYPLKFLPKHIVQLNLEGITMEKLWEGVQSLGSLEWMNLSESETLKEIPDISKATNLKYLDLSYCKSLVRLPSTIGNLQKLEKLDMGYCTRLKDFPVDVNLSSLKTLCLGGCSSLKSFPQISRSIEILYLDDTAIEEIPCCIDMFPKLTKLSMSGCSKLKNISPEIFKLTNLKQVNFAYCEGVITALSADTIKDPYETIEKGNKVDKDEDWYFNFENCLKLDRDARELIIQLSWKWTILLPGGEVPKYFNHRAFGNSLTVILPQSSISHQFLRFNVCVVVEPVPNLSQTLYLQFRFNGLFYQHAVFLGWAEMFSLKNHMVLFSFKFQPTGIPSKLDSNNIEFEFETSWGNRVIKEVGTRLLYVSPSLGDRDQIS